MGRTPESAIQEYGKKRLTEKGCLVRKISYESRRGCPDQLVLVPQRVVIKALRGMDGEAPEKVIFIEYKKAENIEPEPHQVREHERMRAVGADVRVIGSKAQVDALIEELFL